MDPVMNAPVVQNVPSFSSAVVANRIENSTMKMRMQMYSWKRKVFAPYIKPRLNLSPTVKDLHLRSALLYVTSPLSCALPLNNFFQYQVWLRPPTPK